MTRPRQTELQLARQAGRLGDPGSGLEAVRELRRRLDVLEAAHVDEAVHTGWSWQRIADALGVRKQAAHARHARRAHGSREGLVVAGRARQAVARAKREAERHGATAVGTEHLLLGLLLEDEGPVPVVLTDCGVTYDAVVATVADPAPRARPNPEVSPAARSVLEQSMREAVGRGDARLDLEHLLLALLHETGGAGLRAITAQGPSANAMERRLNRALKASAQPSSSSAAS